MWKTPTCAAVLLVALALPWSLEGQDPGVRPDPDGAVRVFGTVVDRTTGDPIPTARVVFAQLGVEGEPSWVGASDEGGRFRTARLPLGVFQIRVEVLSFSVVSHLAIFTEEGDLDIRIEMVPVDLRSIPSSCQLGARLASREPGSMIDPGWASETSSREVRSRS